MISKNSASSRAIPVSKAIAAVRADPFIPEEFGKNQPGMKWDNSLEADEAFIARQDWISASEAAIHFAERLNNLEVHKGLANRILEPFKWHTAILSGTEWSNFFALRTDVNAQPEFRKIALMMQELYQSNEPELVVEEWHLPLVDYQHELYGNHPDCYPKNQDAGSVNWEYWKKVSVGRCARVSYLTHDGIRDPQKDVELHDRLWESGHLSPYEHIATPEPAERYADDWYEEQWSGNFRGWHQYRKDIPNESDFSLIVK
jgi:hypothetical protein